MAERVGFEPTEACTSLVFKTRALNHSTTSPKVHKDYIKNKSFCQQPGAGTSSKSLLYLLQDICLQFFPFG